VDREAIESKLKVILDDKLLGIDLQVLEGYISEQRTHIQNDLGADSLDVVEIIMEIEEEFGIELSDQEAEAHPTYPKIVTLIEQKLAE